MSEKLEGLYLNSVEANNVITDSSAGKPPTDACGASGDGSRVVGNTETSDIKLDTELENKESQTDSIRIAGKSCLGFKGDDSCTKASVDLGLNDNVERVHSGGEEGVLDSAVDRIGTSGDMDSDAQQNAVDNLVSIDGIDDKGTRSEDYLDDENVSVAGNCMSDAAISIEDGGLSGDGKDIKHDDMSIKGCVQESRTEEEGEYNVNDLVWGKVSGHPWWPGQIFEPSAASRKAMKYFKKDSYLIAYFGDHTFAWNDVSRIKPFRMYFNQMEKQSYTEAFCRALDCALDEVSRRVEFGLCCRCVPKELQAKLKSQDVVNRGIRKESCQREGGDNLSTAASFSPAVLIRHLKSLATTQCGVDRLGFVVARSQVLSFNRWKCYEDGLLENDADIHVSQGKEEAAQDDRVPSGNEKETATKSSVKRRRQSRDSECTGKKVKLESGSGKICKEKTDRKVKSDNKYKRSDSILSERKAKGIKKLKPLETVNNQFPMLLGIGERIQRAAIQLGGSTPVLKSAAEFPPLQEMLLKLSLAAKDPMNGYSMLVPFSRFFCDFRNSTSSENVELHDPEEQVLSESETQDKKDSSPGQSETVALNPTTEEQERDSTAMESESEEVDVKEKEDEKSSMVMESESENPSVPEESTPTALILNFQDSESVPPGADLNKIFSRFGPLDESQTEGLGKTKRAKVVFKRRSDAETAFSSAGKYSTFGPSLISYRLHYTPTPSDTSCV